MEEKETNSKEELQGIVSDGSFISEETEQRHHRHHHHHHRKHKDQDEVKVSSKDEQQLKRNSNNLN